MSITETTIRPRIANRQLMIQDYQTGRVMFFNLKRVNKIEQDMKSPEYGVAYYQPKKSDKEFRYRFHGIQDLMN